MNYIDLIILIFITLFGVYGYYRGFLRVFSELVFLFFSLVLALVLYNKMASFSESFIKIPPNVLRVLSFFILWLLFEGIFGFLYSYFYKKIPEENKKSPWNKYLGILPAFFRGIFTVAIILTLLVVLPISEGIKDKIFSSKIGKPLISVMSGVEKMTSSLFGDAINETLTLLTVKPETDESVNLKSKTSNLKIDEQSEIKMLDLVNKERANRGLKTLTMNYNLQKVARAHSKDMFENGYFAHENLKGESPFDRMSKAGIKFLVAGENLALAPNVDLAHEGLMNSPGHKANILNGDFGRVGIGVQDGGIYGKMFTQDFTD